MDRVDDQQVDAHPGEWCLLDVLDLSDDDRNILNALTSRFSDVRHFVLHRGLSNAVKVVSKPRSLFPFLIKLDSKTSIETECIGDRLLRERTPPLSVPPFEGSSYSADRGGIAYRYVTGGRVRDLARRFDTAITDLSTYRSLQIIDDIYDVILKKCHWLDGAFDMRPVQLPELLDPEGEDDRWPALKAAYQRAAAVCLRLLAPHGVIHGDLHAKNVLLTRDDAPVLIDFARARSGQCQMADFATFEAPLQFQVDSEVAAQYWEMQDLQYGPELLIIPHSNARLAACVHRVRSNLWQGCTRWGVKMPAREVDLVYRGFLMHALLRLRRRFDNSPATRERAADQAMLLSGAFS